MTRISTRTLLLALIASGVVFAVGFFFMLELNESAGPEDAVTFELVANEPERYAGQEVTISGEIESTGHFSLADADIAFAIGDDADGEILVYPQQGATLPEGLWSRAVVQVRGKVRPPGTRADAGDGLVARQRLKAEDDAEAVIEATDITVPGGDLSDEPARPAPRRARIEQLLADPRAWDENPILVVGTVHRTSPAGFVLADDGAAIFVGAPTADLSGLDEGQRVEVRAELERLSQFRATTIREALTGTPETDASAPESIDLDQVPDEDGRPFLVLRKLETDPDYGVGTPGLQGGD